MATEALPNTASRVGELRSQDIHTQFGHSQGPARVRERLVLRDGEGVLRGRKGSGVLEAAERGSGMVVRARAVCRRG